MANTEILAIDLGVAKDAALKAVEPWDDGGTCNFDACVLDAPKGVNVEQALAAAGLRGFYRTKSRNDYWGGRWFIGNPLGGQGSARTAQAEAIEKVLKARGWAVTMYYQMD